MPSADHQTPVIRRFDWRGIFRILLVQVLVLLALSAAFIRYVNWSSDQAWAEFSRAAERSAPAARSQPLSSSPAQAIKGRALCERRA